MNERFKELVTQATGRQTPFASDMADWQTIEKLGELIVRECMTQILKESKWYWDKEEYESSNAIQNAARRVQEHFGIDESAQRDENIRNRSTYFGNE